MIKRLYRLFPDQSVILKLTVIHVILALLQGVILGTLVPILDVLLQPNPDFGTIKPWFLLGSIGFFSYLVLTVIATPIGFSACMKLAAQLRFNVMNRITQLPLGWFTADKKARLARTLTADIGAVAQLAVTIGAPAITATLVPMTIIVVTFFINWKVALLFLIIFPAALIVLRWAGNIAAESEKKLEKAATDIAGKAIELGQAQTVLRAAGKAVKGTSLLQKILTTHRDVYRSGLKRSLLPDLSFTTVVVAGFISVILLITLMFINHSLSIPQTIVLFILSVRFLEPLAYLIDLIGALKAMDNAINRVQDILQIETLPMAKHPVSEIKNTDIHLENISFGYGSFPVIKNLSFHFPQGSTTALIGESGSGKTTLIRLIARFYDINTGYIKIDGTDIRQLDYDAMMNNITIIFQDVYLFDTTLKENLLIAKPHATEAELKEAAAAAQLNEMLDRLPHGWDTKVGEGGMQLSGGERQRVSIARAFLKRARIVLIDEAASALDPENELSISKAIANIANEKDRTVIIIAHRLTTIQSANQVIVLSKGKIIESGDPKDLLHQNGHYAKFHQQNQRQKKWKVEG